MLKKRICKMCENEYQPVGTQQKYCQDCRVLYKKNYGKQYRTEHNEELKEYGKEYSKIPEVKEKKNKRQSTEEYKDYMKRYCAEQYEIPEVKEKKIRKSKEYYEQNKEEISEKSHVYNQKPEVKERKNKRVRERMQTDIDYRLSVLFRHRMKKLLKGISKSKKSLEYLGCSVKEYRSYIGSLFTEGMSWEKVMNGSIHIDHKIPCCAFDLKDENQLVICFNYKNTQPLWANDNLLKIKEDIKLDWKRW